MSKLLAPNAADTISRPRLNPVLDTIPQKKLTLVIAGPGYGKTTLMAQVVDRLNLKFIWYRPDSAETDFMGFVNCLVTGIQEYYSDFWREQGAGKLDPSEIEEAFLAQIDTHVTADLFLVLDDCHLLGKSQKINNFLQSLL
ncbi:MAG: AAA family ATPase, partial [Desulfobacteraceae bacterium]|nr:AAA family ATPase [Desulfobacteraceae bacterium]